MNDRTLVAVSAYAGDLGQIETNLPSYLHHGRPVVVLSPVNAPIERVSHASVFCKQAGLGGWIGLHTLERQRLFLELMLRKFGDSWFLLHDADSLCLTARIPAYLYLEQDTFWSNEVLDTNPGESRLPKLAFQPPYFFSRFVLEQMIAFAKRPAVSYSDPATFGQLPAPTVCIDHWMLQVIYAAGLKHRNFLNGASFETTSPEGLNEMVNLVQEHGTVLIHQVKTHAVYHRLVEAHAVCRRLYG